MICPKRTQRRIPHLSVSEAVRCVGAFGALSKCGIVAVWGLSHSAPILRRVATEERTMEDAQVAIYTN